MFKLLTEDEKEKVAHEYILRRAVVMLSSVTVVLVVGIVSLLPSYVLSNARLSEALESTAIMSTSQKEDGPDLQAWLAGINLKLALLSPTLDTDRTSEFIERVLKERISGLDITDFTWTKDKDKINLEVKGRAFDRQTLIGFEHRIESSGYFTDVVLPISNLAKDKDIDFQIKFSPVKKL